MTSRSRRPSAGMLTSESRRSDKTLIPHYVIMVTTTLSLSGLFNVGTFSQLSHVETQGI